MAKPKYHVFVCTQNRPPDHPRGSCAAKGGQALAQALWNELSRRNLVGPVALTGCGCIGPCDAGANLLIYPEGTMYAGVTASDVPRIVDEHLVGGKAVAELLAPPSVWG